MKAGRFSIWLLALLLSTACTYNPFDDSRTSLGKRQVFGDVLISDGSSPDGALVWLEGVNIGTYVKSGKFQITLPARQTINNEESLGGTLRLYFYLANCRLAIRQVVVQNNEFTYPYDYIDENGKLTDTVVLQKFLEIESFINPNQMAITNADSTDFFSVEVRMRALLDTVSVKVPYACTSCPDPLGVTFLRNVKNGQALAIPDKSNFPDRGRALSLELVQTQAAKASRRTMTFTPYGRGLVPGEYEVIPFLLVAHEPIPQALLDYLGINFRELQRNVEPTLDYLKLPFQRTTAKLLLTQ